MSYPFHFSRLPNLPLIEVFNNMCFDQLFNLSQCSRKTAEKIKSLSTEKFRLIPAFFNNYVYVYAEDYVHELDNQVYSFSLEPSKKIQEVQIDGFRSFGFEEKKVDVPVAFWNGVDSFVSYWDNMFIGMKTIIFHLMEIFECSIENFQCSRNFPVKKFLSFLEELMEKQGEIKNLDLSLEKLTDNDLKWILDSVKVTDTLVIGIQPSPNFKYSFEKVPNIMYISHSHWITIENLLSFNSCQMITVRDSNFTNQDMNVFMESWKTGSFPKLEMLRVHSAKLDVQDQIAGVFVGRDSSNRIIKEKTIDNEKFEIYAGWDIQRNDGVTATIKLEKLERWNRNQLDMIVWL